MTAREHPEWMYSVPGPWAVRVRELEAALLESNDGAAKLREIALRLIEIAYDLDREHAEPFLARWLASPNVEWRRP